MLPIEKNHCVRQSNIKPLDATTMHFDALMATASGRLSVHVDYAGLKTQNCVGSVSRLYIKSKL